MIIKFITNSADKTQLLANKLASALKKGDVLTLDGDLGAGKTTFVQGLGRGLGIKGNINSPTFNILKCYFNGKLPLYHIDSYRLEDHVNTDIGLEEVIEGDGIAVIEWPKFIQEMIFEPLEVSIKIVSEKEREISFQSDYIKYQRVFDRLKEIKDEL